MLVLHEVQKVPGWSEVVKRCWDTESAAHRPLKVVLLGSAPLLLKSGAGKGSFSGMETFARAFRPQRSLLVGGEGLPLEQFFQMPTAKLVAG